ncbi:MAG: hypothetical protein ABJF90_17935 [Lentilitoribacter sp.]
MNLQISSGTQFVNQMQILTAFLSMPSKQLGFIASRVANLARRSVKILWPLMMINTLNCLVFAPAYGANQSKLPKIKSKNNLNASIQIGVIIFLLEY